MEPRPMRLALRLALVLTLTLPLSGCGAGLANSTAALPSKAGKHGGMAFPLPGEKGYAEIVVEPTTQSKRDRKVVLAVYFLDPALTSALSGPTSDVKARLTVPGQDQSIDAAFQPKPIKPGDGRFATEVGDFDFDEIRGDLSGTFDGKPFQIPFAVR